MKTELKPLFCEDPFSLIRRIEATDALHASIVALIDQTLACISGKSYGDCLREIQALLAKEKAPEGT